ncbi:MAG: DUF177 domain-containing protein [bacterium]
MKINIQNLNNGIHTYEIITSREALNLENNEIFVNEIKIKSSVEKKDKNILVFTNIKTLANYVCDKCLVNFKKILLDDFSLLYTFDMDSTKYEDDEKIRFINANTYEIDLTSDVRESLLLAVPMKVVCSDDCKGLCQTCGANLNEGDCQCVHEDIDPRWEALKKLLT